jgi:uncharacterized protein (DUF736 family)
MIKTAHADSIRAYRKMIIGHFEQFAVFETETSTDQSGCYVGHIHSLGFSHFRVQIEPAREKPASGPDFILRSLPPAGDGEACDIGAAWKETSQQGEYLSVQLDGPMLPAPIKCALIKDDEDFVLIWKRAPSEAKTVA